MPDLPARRTNVLIRLAPCRDAGKGRLLLARLEGSESAGAELYRVRDAAAAERMRGLLSEAGRESRIWLPEQDTAERKRVAAWFAKTPFPALIMAGRLPFPGSRADVRRLYVMNLPPSLAAAEADLAVTGQDGLSAEAGFFASADDRDALLREYAGHDPRRTAEVGDAVDWLEHDGCARVFLARRLHGEERGVCGNCGWCLGRRGAYLP